VTAGSPLHTPHCGAASHPSSSKCSSPGRRTDRLRTTGRRLRSAAVQGTIRSDPRLAPPARGRARLPHSSARRRPVRLLGLDPGRSGRRRARPLTARSRSSRHAARARPTRHRAHGARIDPGGAAPRVPAMRRGRGVCDRARPRSPCTSGTGAPAIRARCGAPTASRLLDDPTALGIARPGPPDRSGTTHRATERDRSPRPLARAEHPRRRCHAALLSRASAGPAVRRRSAGSDQGQPRKCAGSVAGFPSTFRPRVSPRTDSGRRGRSLRLLAICRHFVPASERL
jgi:hypothetical protein